MSDEMTPATPTEASADNTEMAKATVGISVLTAAGFATGFITKMILSRLLGTLPTNNAYNYVYRLTQDIFRSWEKLIRPTLLPTLARERQRSGEEDAWQFTNSIINLQATLLIVITVVLMVFSPQIVAHFTNFKGESVALATRLLVYLAPSLLFQSRSVAGVLRLN